MAVLRHRYLFCFYCGQKSSRRQDGTVRQWQCAQCEATNHLDEHGHITDPPAPPEQPSVKYAQAESTTSSSMSSDESLFCATCLKNQLLLTENLSSYLPSPTDPTYAMYETTYPVYRQSLEERYPQVCEACEPRVREKIRNAGYLAKTDHLRRMLHRSRGAELGKSRWECGWRGVVVLLGALAWWGSHLMQCIWHVQQILCSVGELFSDDGAPWVRRILQGVTYVVEDRLNGDFLIRWAFILGWTSCWWNNKLMGRLRRVDSRLVGLREYYQLQTLVLLIRMGVLWMSRSEWKWTVERTALRGAHFLGLLFIVVATFSLSRTVRLVFHPRVSFNGPVGPLVERTSNMSKSGGINPTRFTTVSTQPVFPLDKLGGVGSAPPGESKRDYRLLTPPPEVDDGDPMDWTPNVKEKQLGPVTRRTMDAASSPSLPNPNPKPTIPSFSTFTRLPPAPKAPAAILRNPVPMPVTVISSAEMQLQREQQQQQQREQQSSIFQRYDPARFNLLSSRRPKKDEMEMYPQRLFMNEDNNNINNSGSGNDNTKDHNTNDIITSLLGRFGAVFTLSDEPVEVKMVREHRERRQRK